MAQSHVKMADIARELGVSTVAVSKALSGQKGVSEELRARVQLLAGEMGYQSPSQRRAEREKTGYNIGVLIPSRYLDDGETFYWALYRQIAAQAKKRGCFVLFEVIDEEAARSGAMPRLLQENRVSGLIILGKPPFGYARKVRDAWPQPLICLDFYETDTSADSVISNSFFGMYAMTRYLLERGHREIGFIGTLHATDSINDRYLGYCKALMESGLPIRPDWVIEDRDPENGARLEIRLPEPLPTAFVCNNDVAARLLIDRLNSRGLRVPEDVSVTGFDDFDPTAMKEGVGLTTYSVNMPDMAANAVKMLVRRLNGERDQPGMRITDGRLVARDSVRDLREGAENHG